MALEREQARPGHRRVVYNPLEGLGPDTVLFVEDHAMCEDGEDRGEMMLYFSPQLNPHLLNAFARPWPKPCARCSSRLEQPHHAMLNVRGRPPTGRRPRSVCRRVSFRVKIPAEVLGEAPISASAWSIWASNADLRAWASSIRVRAAW